MIRKNSRLFYEKGDTIFPHEDIMRINGIHWGNLALHYKARYTTGNLFTDKKNPVPALQLIKNSVEMYVIDKNTRSIVTNRPDLLQSVQLELSYNCFGYCFAEGKFFLPNPEMILRDEFEMADDARKAEKIIMLCNNGIRDDGNDDIGYVHAVNINANKTISFKPGVNPLIENVNMKFYRHTYNTNQEMYIRSKKK